MKLTVQITIEPQPAQLSKPDMHHLFGEEINEFQQWLGQRNGFDTQPLATVEHAILRGYLYYLYTKASDAPQAEAL